MQHTSLTVKVDGRGAEARAFDVRYRNGAIVGMTFDVPLSRRRRLLPDVAHVLHVSVEFNPPLGLRKLPGGKR